MTTATVTTSEPETATSRTARAQRAAPVRLPPPEQAVARARSHAADRPGDVLPRVLDDARIAPAHRGPRVDPFHRAALVRRVRPRAPEPDVAHVAGPGARCPARPSCSSRPTSRTARSSCCSAARAPASSRRDRSPISSCALLRNVIERALPELRYAFEPVVATEPKVMSQESNPQFAQIAAPTDIVIVVSYDIRVEGGLGRGDDVHPVLEPAVAPRRAVGHVAVRVAVGRRRRAEPAAALRTPRRGAGGGGGPLPPARDAGPRDLQPGRWAT